MIPDKKSHKAKRTETKTTFPPVTRQECESLQFPTPPICENPTFSSPFFARQIVMNTSPPSPQTRYHLLFTAMKGTSPAILHHVHTSHRPPSQSPTLNHTTIETFNISLHPTSHNLAQTHLRQTYNRS